jgi:hypothetical protein
MAQRELVSQALVGMVEEIEGRVPDDETILREGRHVQFADTELSVYEKDSIRFVRFYVWRGAHVAALAFDTKDPLALRFALVPRESWPVALKLWAAQQREQKGQNES